MVVIGSWLVNLNSKFAEEYNMRFSSFIVKEEEKEDFLIKMSKIIRQVTELTNFNLEGIELFEYKEIEEKTLKEWINI